MKKLILSSLIIGVMVLSSGCATQMAITGGCTPYDDGCNSTKSSTVLTDDYIAIGRPSTPIAGYKNPLILAGKKSSIIIQVSNENQDLFEKVLNEKHLLQHLNISVTSGNGNTQKFYIKKDNKKNENITGYAKLYYVKPIDLFTDKERISLEKLGFERMKNSGVNTCYNDGYGQQNGCGVERVYYSKSFIVTMSLAGVANNVDTLNHTFKKPISMSFAKEYTSKAGLLLVLPALVIDIVTLPIQILIYSK